MSTYNLNLTLANIRTITVMFLDIFIMWLVIYYALKIVRNNNRTVQIFKGILLVIIVNVVAQFLGLKTLAYFASIFLNWGFLALIIIFQPEIRSLLEKMGTSNVFSRMTTLTGNEKERLVDQIVTATMLLSKDQTGALISIEQSHSLEDYVSTGTKINSDVTAELLTSIFVTSTPLHDGAVIIEGDKIVCASAYFPPTTMELPSRYGARHRAAIGISEITDAVTIVVSEETGAVSITEGGKIFSVDRKQLRSYLLRVICGETTEVQARKKPTSEDSEAAVIVDDAAAKENAAAARQDTGILRKLAIKKQDAVPAEKIVTEEVIPAKNDMDEETMRQLDEEEAQIKLPKKKKRPVPSYPESAKTHTFVAPVPPVETKVEEPEDLPEPEDFTEEETKTETMITHTMTPEEVEAERQRVYQQFSSKKDEQPVKNEEPVVPSQTTNDTTMDRSEDSVNPPLRQQPILDKAKLEEDQKIYDTNKIDITKIVGFESDLDKTLKMVDTLPDDSPKSDPASKDNTQGGDK